MTKVGEELVPNWLSRSSLPAQPWLPCHRTSSVLPACQNHPNTPPRRRGLGGTESRALPPIAASDPDIAESEGRWPTTCCQSSNTATEHHYNLCSASSHNRLLPVRTGHLTDANFITRLEWFNCLLPLQWNMSPLVVELELEGERKRKLKLKLKIKLKLKRKLERERKRERKL